LENEKIYNLIEKMYSDLSSKIGNLESEIGAVKNTVTRIENEHGKKLNALFDGYVQNTEMIKRIEKKVSKHDDIILRRIK
jgi:hypothetical protein